LRWPVVVVGVLGVLVLASLGQWQMRRADQKIATQTRARTASQEAPIALAGFGGPVLSLQSHRVALAGRWRAEDVVYLDNRPRAGAVGVYVLMALQLDDGRMVMVNRGWLARDAGDRTHLPAYRTASGRVVLGGVAAAGEPRLLALGGAGEQRLGGVWQNFDFAAFSAASGVTPLPLIVREEGPGDDGLLRDWPDAGLPLQDMIDRHHGYALQWFAMAATLAALLIFYGWRNVRRPTT